MKLEDYFEFEKFDSKFGPVERIRIKGTRVAIENVIRDWQAGYMPEQIVANYRTVSLEHVFATLTYYLHDKERVEDYMRQEDAIGQACYQEHLQQEPPEVVKRLKRMKAQRAASEAKETAP